LRVWRRRRPRYGGSGLTKRKEGRSRTPGAIGRPRATEEKRSLPSWLRGSPRAVLAALFAAGSLVTFVAAAGGAITWIRFYAASLPADQALAVVPRGQLIASGAVLLAVFLLLGIFAVIGVYMFDSDGYPRLGMLRGLLALITTECMVVVALATSIDEERRVVAAEGLLLYALVLLLVMRWRDEVRYGKDGEPPGKRVLWGVCTLVGVTYCGVGIVWLQAEDWRIAACFVAAAIVVVWFLLTRLWVVHGFVKPPPDDERNRQPDSPQQAKSRRKGKLLFMFLTGLSFTIASLVMNEVWVAVTLAAVIALGVVSWRVAARTDYDFFVSGVAVFASVPLIGAVAGITRNLDDPQLQPVALLRVDAGRERIEALQGIFVTETDDRIYFAKVATEGCTRELDDGSGWLLWVPRDEVAAMSLGPPQSVEDAGVRAQEMYDALSRDAYRSRVLRRYFDVGTKISRKREDGGHVVTVTHLDEDERRKLGVDDDEEVVTVGGREVDDKRASWNAKDGELRFFMPDGSRGRVELDCDGRSPAPVLGGSPVAGEG
jgi:hypothetical protein